MDHTIASDASHPDMDAAARDGLPLGVMLVIAFLGLDALERAVELGSWLREASTTIGAPRTSTVPNFPVLGLWVAVDVLLVMLLLMRTKAGRLFTAVIFVLHAFYVGHLLVVNNPTLWLYMSGWGRAGVAFSLLLDAIAVSYLLGRQASEALDLA